MQTLRKKSSPCKYKNEPSRFLGDGMTFKAKLIGILEVNEARGDKMCQDALNDLKTAIRAAGEHKQRITISISIEGLRLRDEKTGDSMYHHPVHKISFIAQDMSDSRAFGYIFGSPDTGHRFFGIKTDKTASQVVIAMRDLFQVVFELKKKEIEMAKRHIEQHQLKFGGSSYSDHPLKDEVEPERPKTLKTYESRSRTSSSSITEGAVSRASAAEAVSASRSGVVDGAGASRNSGAIADLLDLEDELNSIQQGISQMDRITPSDPFGPLSGKGETFLESFKEKSLDLPSLPKPTTLGRRSISQGNTKESSEGEKSSGVFSNSASSSGNRATFFPQFPNNAKKAKEETHWFDQETESLFSDAVANPPEPATSPVTFHTPTGEPEQPSFEERKSPMKTDLFTDLDPLGTGKVKPYLDKKDFFQELKNPPKKVLKELISEPGIQDPAHYFPADFESQKSSQMSAPSDSSVIKTTLASASSNILNSFPSKESKYSRIDPFEDTDPFENADPFLEESFPKSIGFPPLLTAKASVDVMQERVTFRYDKITPQKSEDRSSPSPSKSNVFSSSIHGPLRVSLPPEKADTNTTISLSSLASRFRSSPSPTDDTKSNRRQRYQALKQSNGDKSDDQSQSPILEEVYMRGSPKSFTVNSFDKKYFVGSPPPSRSDKIKSKMSGSLELLDSTPDPPPRPKTALFAIKPPPLPPKKQNQPTFRPPARPPSLEEGSSQYDYLRKIEVTSKPRPCSGSNIETSPKKRGPSPSQIYASKLERKNSFENGPSKYPLIAPPPQRKTPTESSSRSHSVTTPTSSKAQSPEMKEPSVLNITLNQLDQSGFESLAATLGVPTENVCNMTLQELTKMLAQKYLGTSDVSGEEVVKQEDSVFQADFESNFGSSGFDKYAAFKELIDDNVAPTETQIAEDRRENILDSGDAAVLGTDQHTTEEEDKYAALRQLSLCAQKSENLSEDLDISNEEDSSARADNISDIIKQNTDDSFTPLHNLEMNESPIAKIPLDESEEIAAAAEKTVETPSEEIDEKKNSWPSYEEQSSVSFDKDKSLFETSGDGKAESFEDANGSWATFEKEAAKEIDDNKETKEEEKENEQSPLSSDGKDDLKVTTKDWSRSRPESNRRDVPWKDDDESWDDYSPKESYWSDESSHDGQSPIKENLPSFHRKAWNKHQRSAKGPPGWSESPPTWHRRWHDDTEDEYEEMWRMRRLRPSSFDRERKKEKSYEGFGRNRDSERFNRGFHTERRKPVETVGEYRRRCDSDASDKEYVALDRGYPDAMGEKDKEYYMFQRQAMDRHWPDHRESRSKYKKSSGHKRPSSASEAKRYEKMYSATDSRGLEKPVVGESEDDDYPLRFPASRRDPRYHSNMEYYGSYDRRAEAVYQRKMLRGRRGGHGSGRDHFESPTTEKVPHHEKLHFFPPDTPRSNKSEDTPEPSKELHFKFEDDFIPSPSEASPSPRESASEKRLPVDDWGRRRKECSSVASDNNNGRFASFSEDPEGLPKSKIEGCGSSGVTKKPSLKGKNHLFGRQDSNTSLRKSESINIFSRENDPFENDDFFSSGGSPNGAKLSKFFSEKSKSNTNVSDPFAWKDMFGNC